MVKQLEDLKEKISEWEGAEELAPQLADLEKRIRPGKFGRLFQKNGEFSITRAILICAWALGLALYAFGSLFAGAQLPAIGLTVPGFDSGAFLSVTGAACSLYFATHNVKVEHKKS